MVEHINKSLLADAEAELQAWQKVSELRKTGEVKDPLLTMLLIKHNILVSKGSMKKEGP